MEKELIIERLNKTLTMLKELREDQFNFSKFVSKLENGCGTVCCIAGWYPKYFPESGLVWSYSSITRLGSVDESISISLSKYHGLPEELIGAIFMRGTDAYVLGNSQGYLHTCISYRKESDRVTLRDAIGMIETVIKCIEEEKI